MHGCAIDPFSGRLWLSHGDWPVQGVFYSDDDGRTWTPLAGASGLHTFAFAPKSRVGWGAGEQGRIIRLTY